MSRTECKFLHTSNPKFLPNAEISSQIGCIIVDTNEIDPDSIDGLIKWARTNAVECELFLETDANSDNLRVYKQHSIPVWGWDPQSLREDFKHDLEDFERNPVKYDNPFSISIFHIKNCLTGVKRELDEVDSLELTIALKEARDLFFEIKGINRRLNNSLLHDASISFLTCIYKFERMLAPLEDTEKECKKSFLAKSFTDRIDSLEKWERLLVKSEPLFSSFWGKTHAISRDLYFKFQTIGNPKYERIKEMLKQCMAENTKVSVLNSSEPFARALSNALERDLSLDAKKLEEKGIHITSITSGQPNAYYDKCIIFGQIPYNKTWLLHTVCAKHIMYLVYPSEKLWLKYQFEEETRRTANNFNRETRVTFLKRILSKEKLVSMPPHVEVEKPESIDFGIAESEKQEEEKIKPLFEDLKIDDDLAFEDDVSFDYDNDLDESTISDDGVLIVNCCKMKLDDGSVMYFKASRRLPILKEGKKLEYMDYRQVKKGDTLIIIKNNIRNNLASEIIKKADNHPIMQRIKFLVNSWVVALIKGMEENNDTTVSFLAKLQKKQQDEHCREVASPLTVQLWREGYVIGPQNPLNIKLIGKIYNQQFLVDNYQDINAAITRLRGIHQSLLRKFNEMVILAGLKNTRYNSDDLIDEEFNLYLGDFIDIISFARIESIQPDASTARSNLNKKLKE